MKQIAVIIVFLIILWMIYTPSPKKCNNIDGRCYRIVSKYDADTHSEASQTLAHLNTFALKLIRHLRNKYLWQKQGSREQRDMVEFLMFNYNPDNIIENSPNTNVNTSYVEDKGKVFAICIREKQSGKNIIHDRHILEFVVLHEMSHLANKTIGHGPEFWKTFKFMLQEAYELGIHTPVDYSKHPINYCSLPVNYNPYFDKTL